MTFAYLKYICAQKHKLDWNNISENEGYCTLMLLQITHEKIQILSSRCMSEVSQVEFYKLD